MTAYVGSDNKVRVRDGKRGERVKLADGRDLSANTMEMLRHESAGLELADESQLAAVKALWEQRNGRPWNP